MITLLLRQYRHLCRPTSRLSQTFDPEIIQPALDLIAEFSRKSKKGVKHGKAGWKEGSLDGILSLDETETSMEKAITHLKQELANIRSGRATSGMLDHLKIETEAGDAIPLRAVGTVTVKDARLLNISLFDPQSKNAVSKAVENSPLQLQVKPVGDQELLVSLPQPTKEAIDGLVKIVSREGENSKKTIRHARKLGMSETGLLTSEDDKKKGEKAVDALTEYYIDQINEICELKEKDLVLK